MQVEILCTIVEKSITFMFYFIVVFIFGNFATLIRGLWFPSCRYEKKKILKIVFTCTIFTVILMMLDLLHY